ncbi:proton-conducting transporter transmembrane domain-containing protein [Arenibaculum pallidiluteum]|uniref:proton-conducting transporter transmembrane domain-containing protein n=1 Tax=Arenibaculum pallidiluteum TaxID=2812559 RepID=UPI001A97D274|nr:proton-conducting transporter membrane subunit [Arenibaculum pallidiluteum]
MPAILTSVLLLLVLAPLGLARGRGPHGAVLVHGGAVIASVIAAAAALLHLGGFDLGAAAPLRDAALPWLRISFGLDLLSAYFLVAVNLCAAFSSISALGQRREGSLEAGSLAAYPILIAGMNLVPLARDAYSLLLGWGVAGVASWLLLLSSEEAGAGRAARIHLILSGFGLACLLIAFALLGGSSADLSFESLRVAAAASPAGLVPALVILGIAGGIGLAPLHVWLPGILAAGPARVSALMAGAMPVTAYYVLLRAVFDLAGGPGTGWGALLAGIGAATALGAALRALMEADLPRILGVAAVGSLGLVAVGTGGAAVYDANGLPNAAGLALSGALLHGLNHAVFIGLLFLAAGAVVAATGEMRLDRLGGLVARMPWTAAAFLAGGAALAALPPLNGFVAAWLLFQAFLQAPDLADPGLRIGALAVAAAAILSAALFAMVVVRCFGLVFLGRPRSEQADMAADPEPVERWSMLLPAVLCALIGVLPLPLLALIEPVAAALLGTPESSGARAGVLWLAPQAAFGNAYSGLLVLAMVLCLAVLTAAAVRRIGGRAARRAPPWAGGAEPPIAGTPLSASGLAQPILRVFAMQAFAFREEVGRAPPGDTGAARYRLDCRDPVETLFFLPLGRRAGRLLRRAGRGGHLGTPGSVGLAAAALASLMLLAAVLA